MDTLGFINEQGKCPKCDSNDLGYGAISFEDDNMCYFPWACKKCGLKGEEWYKLDFQGHNIYTEKGEVIEL